MDPETQTIEMWTRGDYRIVGDWFAAASRQALGGIGALEDKRVLDVACGTGAVAIAAAQRGAHVTGLDLTPSMLEEAERRAREAGVEITWVQGSFDALGHLGTFDAVTSAFGVMFARDPVAVAKELTSACAPGGRICVVAWDQDGAFGSGGSILEPWLEGLPKGPETTLWAEEDSVRAFFEELPAELIEFERHELLLPFDSVDAAFSNLETHSGPWHMILEYFGTRGTYDEAKSAILEHLHRHSRSREDGGVNLRVAYVVSTFART